MSNAPARPRISFSPLSANEILTSITAGIVVGILIIFIEVSLAAMIFSGELEYALSQGIGVFLLGALIMGLLVTFTSSVLPVMTFGQDSPAAIIAVIASAVVTSLSLSDPDHQLRIVIAIIMTSSVSTGIIFWLMGRFNLGRLVRFIPYPVIGGFLSGTGWLLLLGGFSVMTETPFGLALFDFDVLLRWLPGVVFAIALFVTAKRYSHFLVVPAVIFGSILLFYIIYFFSTGSLSSDNLAEWQLGPFPKGGLFTLAAFDVFTEGHIQIVWSTIIDFSSITIISAIALLLNASGLELIYGEDFDLNKELKVTGIANIVAGLFGGPPGYLSISLSALGRRLGTRNRLVGVIAFSLLGVTLFFGASALSFFPRVIAGGLLVYLGILFMSEWIFDAWNKLPKLDYFLIWFILIVIASVGFLEGVAAGIVVASILFVFNYSRVNVVRHDVTAANFPSYVMRPRLYNQLLRQRGDSLYLLELQGFIFFGTADNLVSQIRKRIENPDLLELRFLVLDFRLVTGIDSSAALSFSKLGQLASSQGINVVFTDLSLNFQEVLGDKLCNEVHIFPDLDHGIAWCEERMIDVFKEVGLVAKPKTLIQLIEESLAEDAKGKDWLGMMMPDSKREPSKHTSRLLKYLEQIEAAEGEYLLNENYEIDGLYFIEEGQIRVFSTCEDNSTIILMLLERGTIFGELDYYAEQKATACYVANRPSKLFFLSLENIERMEKEDPNLAIAMHRIISGTMSKKLSLASETIQALRK